MFQKFTTLILMIALASSSFSSLLANAQATDPLSIESKVMSNNGNPASVFWSYSITNNTNADISLDFKSNIDANMAIADTFCSQSNCVGGQDVVYTEVIPANETKFYYIEGNTEISGKYCDKTSFDYKDSVGAFYNTSFDQNCATLEVFTTPQITKDAYDDGKGNIIWSYSLTNYGKDLIAGGSIVDVLQADQTSTGIYCFIISPSAVMGPDMPNPVSCSDGVTINGQEINTKVSDLKSGETLSMAVKSKAGTNNQEYCNVASFDVVTYTEIRTTGESEKICKTVTFEDKLEVSKRGSYNFDTKQIEWDIILNNSGADKEIELKDIVPAGTSISSVECQNMYNDPAPCDHSVTSDAGKLQGTVRLKYDDIVSFQVKADVANEGEYCNTATYTGSMSGQTEESCVTVNNESVIVTKNSYYDEDAKIINWSIVLENRGADTTVRLKDILDSRTVLGDNTKCFTATKNDCDSDFTKNNNTLEGEMTIPNKGYGAIYFSAKVEVDGEYCNVAQYTIESVTKDTNKECVIVGTSSISSSVVSSAASSMVSSISSSVAISAMTSLESSATTSSESSLANSVSSVESSTSSSISSAMSSTLPVSSITNSEISSGVTSSEMVVNAAPSSVSSTAALASSEASSLATSSEIGLVTSSAISTPSIASSIVSSTNSSTTSSLLEASSSVVSITADSKSTVSSATIPSLAISTTTSSVISSVTSSMVRSSPAVPVVNVPMAESKTTPSTTQQNWTINAAKPLLTVSKFQNGVAVLSSSCSGKNVELTNNKVIKESDLSVQGANTFKYGLYQFEAKCDKDLTVTVAWEAIENLDNFGYKKFVNGKYLDFPVAKSKVSVDGKTVATATFTISDNGLFDNDKTVGIIKDPAGPSDLDPAKTMAEKKALATARSGGNINYWIIGSIAIISIGGASAVYFKKRKA